MKEKKRILAVDDDKAILKSLKDILESEGYDVDVAESGLEAIRKLETGFYNLSLLDIKLPDMEGTELLTKMHKGTPRMMKIVITGYPSLENVVDSLNLGADAYLMKPIDPAKLLEIVEEKLKEQEEAEKMSQEKLTEWIQTRIKKLEGKLVDTIEHLEKRVDGMAEEIIKKNPKSSGK